MKSFKIPGVSFSWKRATGLTAARQRMSRWTGVPTTRIGLERKLGSLILDLFVDLLSGKRR